MGPEDKLWPSAAKKDSTEYYASLQNPRFLSHLALHQNFTFVSPSLHCVRGELGLLSCLPAVAGGGRMKKFWNAGGALFPTSVLIASFPLQATAECGRVVVTHKSGS